MLSCENDTECLYVSDDKKMTNNLHQLGFDNGLSDILICIFYIILKFCHQIFIINYFLFFWNLSQKENDIVRMHWPESKETFFNQNVNAFMILSIMNAALAVDASYVAINNYYKKWIRNLVWNFPFFLNF